MSEWIKAAMISDEVQAELVESALREQGIPFTMHSYHDSMLDGLFQAMKGWGHVETSEEYAEQVRQLVADIAGSKPDPGDIPPE